MNGRMIREAKLDEKTMRKISEMPSYVEGWFINMKASDCTSSTCYDYVYKVWKFLSFINADVKKVKLKDINERNITKYMLSVRTINKRGSLVAASDSYVIGIWKCLNNFLEYLYQHSLIEKNYMKGIRKPKDQDLERINQTRVLLTKSDFSKILKAVDIEKSDVKKARNRAVLALLMFTGMRESALSNIMLSDINFKEKTIVVLDKGKKRHQYFINQELGGYIDSWLSYRNNYVKENDNLFLFLNNRGGQLEAISVVRIVERYSRLGLGKRISPHKLRAGFCSILYENTHDIEFVRRAVGHASSTTTQRYIVTKGDEKAKAAEIMSGILS